MLQIIENWLKERGTVSGGVMNENNRLDLFLKTLREGDY